MHLRSFFKPHFSHLPQKAVNCNSSLQTDSSIQTSSFWLQETLNQGNETFITAAAEDVWKELPCLDQII